MSRALHTLQRIMHGWDVFALALWVVFLAGFAPLCLYNGMTGGALLCGLMGLFVALLVLRPWSRHGPRWRRIFAWVFGLEQVLIVPAAAVLMGLPPSGGWTRLPHTEWSNTVLLHSGEALIGECSDRDGGGLVLALPRGSRRWQGLKYPGGHGWSLAYDANTRRLWVGPRSDRELYALQLAADGKAAGKWQRFADAPRGRLRRIAVAGDRVFVVVRNRIYARAPFEARWRPVSCGAKLCPDVGVDTHAGRTTVLAVGRRWRESQDGGATFADVTPAGRLPRWPRVALGGGWRYVYAGGMFGGSLHVAAAGQRFEKRALPVRDIRILVVDPRDGKHAWLGSWGEGVYRTIDGGRSWQAMGLERNEVRALAVDWTSKIAYAATANTVFHRGIWSRRY